MPQVVSHFFHYPHHVLPKQLKVLFLAKIFHVIGMDLEIFFLPLFLFQIGQQVHLFSNWGLTAFQQGMFLVGGYFLLQRIGVTLSSLPVGKFVSKVGVRNGLILGQILNVVIISLFSLSSQRPELLLLVIVLEIIKIPLFWTSYFSMFSNFALYKKMGASVGTIEFFTRLIQVSIPAIAGVTILSSGFSNLFLIGLAFHSLSALILLLVQNTVHCTVPSLAEMKTWLLERDYQRVSLSFIGKYFLDSLQFLWPFFVFLLLGSTDKVGFLYSFVFFISLLFIYFTGWFVDHKKSMRPFTISGIFVGILWVLRSMVYTIWGIIAIDIVDKLAQSIFSPFYYSLLIRRGKGHHSLAYFVYREIVVSFGGIIFWALFLFYFYFFTQWQGFLLLGAIGVPLSLQLHDRHLKSSQP